MRRSPSTPSIVEAETSARQEPPVRPAGRDSIQAGLLKDDKQYLEQLRKLGKAYGATGEVEEVAGRLKELMDATLETATSEGAESEAYEAHAVLL